MMLLYQIKAKEHKYPNEVYKVPVETCFFYHFIMAALIKMAEFGFEVHHDIDHHTTENMKTVEAGNTEKISSKCNRSAVCGM